MNYLDFELNIERQNEKYTARVIRSPVGEASTIFTLPFSEEKLENLVLKIGRLRGSTRRIHSEEMEAVREFGGKLFESVFSGEVNACLRSSLDEASRQAETRKKETGLRLKLRLQEVPELANLPWEFLFNSSLNRFFAQSIQTPIVRYIEMPERIKPLSVQLPLQLLAMISSPADYVRLDVERERLKLQEALQSLSEQGKVQVKWLENATLTNLQRCLRDGKYHIFHFIGHGGFDKKEEEGVLVLEDEQERGWLAGAHRIGTVLHDHSSLRLAVLNSCEGARNSRTDPFAGVATSLIQQGIPAVVAMQFEITDEAAIKFAGEFYDALAKGYPVDAAVGEARKAIYNIPNDVEWGTPVLYMRSPDGILFNIERREPPPGKKETEKLETKIKKPKPPADDLLSKFKKAMSESDWDTAIELGEEMLKVDANKQPVRSETAMAYKLRGQNYSNKKNREFAIADFNRAIELDENNDDYYYMRGAIYANKGEYDKAIADYNRAIQFNPNKAEYYLERGKCYVQKADYDHAIADFNRAIEIDPNNGDYYWERGMGYANKGEYDKAIADYNRAIQFNPNKAEYYYSRGVIQANKGNNDTAIADFNRAIQLDPNKADYNWERGKCYSQKGDYDHAITSFNRAIELDQNKADYYFDRGKVYIVKADHNRAIGNFNRAIQLQSKAEYYYSRGMCYANRGEHDKAIADYNRAIKLDPNKAEYYLECGKSYVQKADHDRAVTNFDRAIQLDPNMAGYYFERGVSYANRGEYDKAIADYNQAIQLDSKKANYYFERGYSYTNKGDYEEAINNFDHAVELDQNNADYYYARCLCYANKGDYDKAIEDFKHAIQLDPDKANLLLHELRRQRRL